jgi:ABC-type glycerol-3-phosphate transport system substrate-binding protein
LLRFLKTYKMTLLFLIATTVFIVVWNANRGFNDEAMASVPRHDGLDESSILQGEDTSSLLEPSYYKYIRLHKESGASDSQGFQIVIPSLDYSGLSPDGTAEKTGLDGMAAPVVALLEEDSWADYEVTVPEDGFYQMGMSYYALPGKRSDVVRSVMIDGKYPFFQAKKLDFSRMWREAGEPWHDNQNNQYNPKREEVSGWQYRDFTDAEAKVEEPFRFYMTKGTHVVRIHTVREPAAIGELRVFSPKVIPDYDEISRMYEEKGYKKAEGQLIKVQAETSTLRSDPTLKRIEDREPDTEPFNKDAVVLNSFGGLSWRDGGQWAEWEFEVPESGLYHIGARFGQWFLNGIPVQRKITINGELPFKEMNAVSFPYKAEWQISTFSPGDDSYLFYLEKGKNIIRMEVQIGGLGEILENVTDTIQKMSLLTREVIRVTGTNPDPNADWKLDRNIPDLEARLQNMAWSLEDGIQSLYDFGVKRGSSEVSTLYEARDVLLSMVDQPSTIPARLTQFTELQSSLGLWVYGLSRPSLVLDYLIVKSPEQEWPRPAAPWYVRAGTSVGDLFRSFTKEYGGVGTVYAEDEEVLDVWIARGRDWVEIIKQMIDEDFTPETGIKVNVNVIPAQQMQLLMLANTSGMAPDVALGVEGEVPIDFAVRNALVNLNEFQDYEAVADRFRPGALIPYKYDGGDYALPENQNFYMLFYRKDIMSELGVSEADIPQTWQEVMDLIPLLQQNGMDFFYPHAPNMPQLAINEFAPFLFQNGGDFYTENGARSALDSPEAMEAMRMWTGLFTNYRIAKQADFYNRFRSGEMPIGVADYSTYILLSTAAPELTGWWSMKPMPGMKQENGQINRSTGGLAQTGIIFKSSKSQEEAWEFLKWWTGADAQERFGSELEALLGVEARWNTANVEALERLPWQQSDIEAILEQWEWFREREVVLGGYFTTRHVANMWNEIVLNGRIHREAVEAGVKEINKELRKKREEFGLDRQAGQGEERVQP